MTVSIYGKYSLTFDDVSKIEEKDGKIIFTFFNGDVRQFDCNSKSFMFTVAL